MVILATFSRKLKSSTKVQQKMHIRKQSVEINKKKIDSICVIRYTALAQACLKAKCWRVDDKVQTGFLINFERARVWAAWGGSSYEVGFTQ